MGLKVRFVWDQYTCEDGSYWGAADACASVKLRYTGQRGPPELMKGRAAMRWSVGKQISPRGAGLGNEVFPWAKAYLGAEALGLRCVNPAWRLNPRRYDKYLGGTLLDSAKYIAAQSLPSVEITSKMYHSTGQTDYFEALGKLRQGSIDRRFPVLVHSSGMSGGYLAIRRAKGFLQHALLGSPDAILARAELDSTEDPTVRVAVHVRGGDFQASGVVARSGFNQTLPLEWYRSQLETLTSSLALPIKIFLATDSPSPKVTEGLTIGDTSPREIGSSSISDLAVLAHCDILISSVSSFSMLAAFLSDAPYVWHREQLHESGGWLSIWGHESEDEGGGPTRKSQSESEVNPIGRNRGLAHAMKPAWPSGMIQYLEQRALMRVTSSDLIHYGVIQGDERTL